MPGVRVFARGEPRPRCAQLGFVETSGFVRNGRKGLRDTAWRFGADDKSRPRPQVSKGRAAAAGALQLANALHDPLCVARGEPLLDGPKLRVRQRPGGSGLRRGEAALQPGEVGAELRRCVRSRALAHPRKERISDEPVTLNVEVDAARIGSKLADGVREAGRVLENDAPMRALAGTAVARRAGGGQMQGRARGYLAERGREVKGLRIAAAPRR